MYRLAENDWFPATRLHAAGEKRNTGRREDEMGELRLSMSSCCCRIKSYRRTASTAVKSPAAAGDPEGRQERFQSTIEPTCVRSIPERQPEINAGTTLASSSENETTGRSDFPALDDCRCETAF
jgi:hypothetical protein